MSNFLDICIEWFSMLACLILLYFSILKCFWDGEKNRFVLFLVIFFTNPFFLYFGVFFFVGGLYSVYNLTLEQMLDHEYLLNALLNAIEIPVITTFLVIILQTVLAIIVGKWLKTKHLSLIVFVYLMFLTLILNSTQQYDDSLTFDSATQRNLLAGADYVLSALTMGLFYFLNIKKLSRLTFRPFGTSKLVFIVPPALYCIVFNILSFRTLRQNDITLVIYYNTVSLLISFLLICLFSPAGTEWNPRQRNSVHHRTCTCA